MKILNRFFNGNFITEYRWLSDIDGLLSTDPGFAIAAADLSVGSHTLTITPDLTDPEFSGGAAIGPIQIATSSYMMAGNVHDNLSLATLSAAYEIALELDQLKLNPVAGIKRVEERARLGSRPGAGQGPTP